MLVTLTAVPRGWRALQLRRDALQIEHAYVEIAAGLEPHLEAAARAAYLGPRLLHQRQRRHARLERKQNLALDDLRCAAGPREGDEDAVAGQRGEELDGYAPPGNGPHQHDAQEEHRHRHRAPDGNAQHGPAEAGRCVAHVATPVRLKPDTTWLRHRSADSAPASRAQVVQDEIQTGQHEH